MGSTTQVTEPENQQPPAPVLFRGKKRKTYRQRNIGEEEEEQEQDAQQQKQQQQARQQEEQAIPNPTPEPQNKNDDKEDDESAISEALRLRNARKSRLRGGVMFGLDNNNNSQTTKGIGGGVDDELSLMIREEEKKAMEQATAIAASRRFAPQTGIVGEIVNKHMEEYIEAELAKRHPGLGLRSSLSGDRTASSTKTSSTTTTAINKSADKHTAFTGKLFEVDLGDEVRSRNALETDRATRKLQGLAVEDEEDQQQHPKKVRIGKDGKPWRPRNRRDSDDIKRDQLVEEILRENKLDVYKTPAPQQDPNAVEDETEAADDRIAEQFRREFLDAMAERQRRRRRHAAPPAKPGVKKEEEGLRGPKLGGSRNTRAAYRDMLLQKEKEKKK